MTNAADPLKIYFDQKLVELHPELPTATLLYPYLGVYPESFNDSRAPMSTRYNVYMSEGRRHIELTRPEEAEFFVFPFEWYGLSERTLREELIDRFFESASKVGRQGIVFAYGDEYVDLSYYKHSLVIQSNVKRSSLKPNERIMPAFVEDMYRGLQFAHRSRDWREAIGFAKRPSISFCGFSGSAPERQAAIETLKRSHKIRRRFIVRDRYYGGAWDNKKNGFDFDKLGKVRNQFVDSLYSADYVLCVRGYGNYSARFYEAACCGKIPLLVDSDCALPLSDLIEYDKFVVRINSSDIGRMDDILARIDESISDEEFVERQRIARQVWKDFLSPEGYFANLRRVLQPTN